MDILIVLARFLFSLIFLSSGINHLTNTSQMSEYAASKNVPAPAFAVFGSGIMLLMGGLSILLGIWVNIGAWLLIIFLLLAALMMHNFWTIEDPAERQNQQIHFFKNMAMAGGAVFIWYLYMVVDVPFSLNTVF